MDDIDTKTNPRFTIQHEAFINTMYKMKQEQKEYDNRFNKIFY